MTQDEKPKELFRVEYSASWEFTSGLTPFHHDEHSEGGTVHVKASNKDEANELARIKLNKKYGQWDLTLYKASPANFADIWRDKTTEKLFNKYLISDSETNEPKFYKRRAAARILAQRNHQPAGEVLLKWLQKPEEGIREYATGYTTGPAPTDPWEYNYSKDANSYEVQHLAAESLGLMKYQPAKAELERLTKDEEIEKKNPKLHLCFRIASQRIDGFDTYFRKGMEIDEDILLFAAATSDKEFFRTSLFKGLVNHVIFDDYDYWFCSSTKKAERYIEALRRVPDLKIPVICEDKLKPKYIESSKRYLEKHVPEVDLTSFLAVRGMQMDIEKLESVCNDVLNIIISGKYLKDKMYVPSVKLFDDSRVNVDENVEEEVRKALEKNGLLNKIL